MMTRLLAGDIGGTKTILRLVEASGTHSLTTLYESTFPSGSYPDLVPLVQEFLMIAGQQLGEIPAPTKACFAIAGPVVKNRAKLTNLPWELDATRLSQALAIAQVRLINDFAAVGYGVLGLQATDLIPLQTATPQADAPIAVIGAGTGLGEGFLVHQGETYQVFPTEGGHADFAPRNELEFDLLHYLRQKYNIRRVSVERVVSGQGIVAIYQFLRDRGTTPESAEITEIVRTAEHAVAGEGKIVDPAAAIAHAALDQRDRLCEQTMQLFIRAYGAEAGNLALKLLPYGGLYVAGGIAGKILPLMQNGDFLAAFRDKGRVSVLLEQVPLSIVSNPLVGLIGAAISAARL